MTGAKSTKVRVVMLNDMPHFWKKGDKRRVRPGDAKVLIDAGWAKMVDDPPKVEEKK